MEPSKLATLIIVSITLLSASDATPHDRIRIISGSNAKAGENPWQVSIQFEYPPRSGRFVHICGGSVVNSRWILTAAHCFKHVSGMNVRVVAGDYRFSIKEDSEEHSSVTKIILHDDFVSGSYNNDIALMKLSERLRFTDYVSAISLPGSDQQVDGQCTATGWGAISRQPPYEFPDNLMEVNLPIIDTDTCEEYYGSHFTDSMICAGTASGGSGTCRLDSGGPLICSDQEGQQYLAGVVSYGGIPCAQARQPSVFISVPFFRSWMGDVIANN